MESSIYELGAKLAFELFDTLGNSALSALHLLTMASNTPLCLHDTSSERRK